jgi:hypothetical protein
MENSEYSREFPKVSRTEFDEVISVGQGYNKLFERWVLKMPTGAHKTQSIASVLISQRDKDGDEFLNHIVRVSGDDSCVLFVNV